MRFICDFLPAQGNHHYAGPTVCVAPAVGLAFPIAATNFSIENVLDTKCARYRVYDHVEAPASVCLLQHWFYDGPVGSAPLREATEGGVKVVDVCVCVRFIMRCRENSTVYLLRTGVTKWWWWWVLGREGRATSGANRLPEVVLPGASASVPSNCLPVVDENRAEESDSNSSRSIETCVAWYG